MAILVSGALLRDRAELRRRGDFGVEKSAIGLLDAAGDLLVLLGGLLEVDDLEEGVDEVAAVRAVVVVVGVLPDVEREDGV
mgnify:CR=1 FL=1